jgi:hypothetical protein
VTLVQFDGPTIGEDWLHWKREDGTEESSG